MANMTFKANLLPDNTAAQRELGSSTAKWAINGVADPKLTDTLPTINTTGDGNAITAITISGNTITATKGSTFNNYTYTLPTATTAVKGGIKVGSGLSMSGEVLNHSNSITAKTSYGSTATTARANGGKIIVTDIQYDAQGHITHSTDRTITLSQTTYSLSGLGGIGTVSASGTAPLSLSASKSGTTVTISGSVAAATTAAAGVTQYTAANLNTWLNQLTTGSSDPVDTDWYISQYAGGGTTTTTFHRRPVSNLYNYIKTKLAVTNNNINLSRNTETTIATIGGTAIKIKLPASDNTDTKNTAGSTDTSSKIFLVGATSQTASAQTYSDNQVYVTNGQLDANVVQVATHVKLQYNTTTNALDFVFV